MTWRDSEVKRHTTECVFCFRIYFSRFTLRTKTQGKQICTVLNYDLTMSSVERYKMQRHVTDELGL